jgi:hypothetical protein
VSLLAAKMHADAKIASAHMNHIAVAFLVKAAAAANSKLAQKAAAHAIKNATNKQYLLGSSFAATIFGLISTSTKPF